MLYLGIFEQKYLIWVYLEQKLKLHGKPKTPKFGIKNVVFEYFWATILKILLPYLKLASSSLSISKIEPKTSDFGIFVLEFENNIVIFELSILEFV